MRDIKGRYSNTVPGWAGRVRKVQSESRVFHDSPHRPITCTTRLLVMRSGVSNNAISAVFLQDACLKHQYVRSRDLSTIVERPERIRAVKAGLAVALSRLEGLNVTPKRESLPLPMGTSNPDSSNPDDLAQALDQMTLEASTVLPPESKANPIQVIRSTAIVDILDNAAVKFIHGDIDRDVYLEKLKDWVADSIDKISKGESEIPLDLPQGDLYCKPLPILYY